MEKKIRVVIADDNEMFADALKDKLEENDNIQVTRVFNDLTSLVLTIQSMTLDILLLDINFHGVDSIAIVSELKSKLCEFKIIILTTTDNDYWRELAATKEIRYVRGKEESNSLNKLIKDIIQIANNTYEESELMHSKKSIIRGVKITRRKVKILQYLYKYANLKEEGIAKKLNIKPRTLKTHKQELFAITNTSNNTDLIKYGIKNGLILP